MTLVDAETGEIVDSMGEAEARVLVERINRAATDIVNSVERLWRGQGWVALGYDSWGELCEAQFADVPRLGRDDRAELVRSLRGIGMSTRAIASATGVSKDTVRNDLRPTGESSPVGPEAVTGTNGKTYLPHPKPYDPDDFPPLEKEAPTRPGSYQSRLGRRLGPVRRTPAKRDVGNGLHHPAPYSDALLALFRDLLAEHADDAEPFVLDPFAGTGRIHELRPEVRTVGIEIEREWAELSEHTVHGDALELPWDAQEFDAIVTSPTYGNRLADSHNASDPERRRSYTHDLGRTLADTNSGGMQWGDEYRRFHRQAWIEAARVLRDGGLFLLNIKDHVRDGQRQYVAAWHVLTLHDLGIDLLCHHEVPTRGLMAGANHGARAGGEMVYVLRKAER